MYMHVNNLYVAFGGKYLILISFSKIKQFIFWGKKKLRKKGDNRGKIEYDQIGRLQGGKPATQDNYH